MHVAGFLSRHQFVLRQHWPWLVSLALLCFIGEVLLIEVPALNSENVELMQSQHRVMRQLTELNSTGQPAHTDLLLAHLATFERLSVVTHDMNAIAQETGLSLTDATYKATGSTENADVKKIEISVRLKGAYEPLKKMLGLLMTSHEGLSLESVSIRRNHANDTVNDIEVQLAFYYRTQA